MRRIFKSNYWCDIFLVNDLNFLREVRPLLFVARPPMNYVKKQKYKKKPRYFPYRGKRGERAWTRLYRLKVVSSANRPRSLWRAARHASLYRVALTSATAQCAHSARGGYRFARLTRAAYAARSGVATRARRAMLRREEIRAPVDARRRVRSCEVVPHGGGNMNERIGWGSRVAVDPACVCRCRRCVRERVRARARACLDRPESTLW